MEVYSATLQNYLRSIIDELPYNQRVQLKTLRCCNTRLVMPKSGHEPGAFLLANEENEQASFFGLMNCNNAWACPCCTAKKMAGYAEQFAIILDEMKKRGYFAFMATITMPHLAFMKCRETTDILYNVWKFYNRSRNYCGKGGKNAIKKFAEAVDLKHFVGVLEYTYGKNGWHPHFHVIYWVKREYKDKILEWEKPIADCLRKAAKRETLKYWNKNNLYMSQEWRDSKIEEIYSNLDPDSTTFYISKNGEEIAESQSGQYIAGWGADAELSQLQHKEAQTGHYTPHQILQLAYDGDEKMKKLYVDFCLAVTQKPYHYRVSWSRTGIHNILKQAIQKVRCEDLLKKKESAAAEKTKWEVLCWFDVEQYACLLELSRNSPIFSNILWLAIHRREILFEFLDRMGVKYHLPNEHFFTAHIENIYSGRAG